MAQLNTAYIKIYTGLLFSGALKWDENKINLLLMLYLQLFQASRLIQWKVTTLQLSSYFNCLVININLIYIMPYTCTLYVVNNSIREREDIWASCHRVGDRGKITKREAHVQDTERKDSKAWKMKEDWAEHRKKWKRLQDMLSCIRSRWQREKGDEIQSGTNKM